MRNYYCIPLTVAVLSVKTAAKCMHKTFRMSSSLVPAMHNDAVSYFGVFHLTGQLSIITSAEFFSYIGLQQVVIPALTSWVICISARLSVVILLFHQEYAVPVCAFRTRTDHLRAKNRILSIARIDSVHNVDIIRPICAMLNMSAFFNFDASNCSPYFIKHNEIFDPCKR